MKATISAPFIKKFPLQEKPLRKIDKSMQTVADRMDWIRCVFGYTPGSLGRKIGTDEESIMNVLNPKNDNIPTTRMIHAIITMFPVSKEWLIEGTGKPFTLSDVSSFVFKRVSGNYISEGVAERLKQIRMESGKTQADFAYSIGTSRDSLSFTENSKATLQLPVLVKLISVYKVDAHWLLLGEGDMYRRKK